MKTKRSGKYIIYTLIGFTVLAAGAILLKSTRDVQVQGIMLTLPYIFIGIGSGIFGQNLGTIFTIHAMKEDPQVAKQKEIEVNDERNTAIRNKAKAKAYDLMVMVFGSLMLAFALMQADWTVVAALIAAYLFVTFSNIYFINKYNKEM